MKSNKKLLIFIICLYCLIFQNFIKDYFHLFQYFDELLAIIGLVIFVFSNKDKNDKKIMTCIILLLIIGIIPNVLYKYQKLSLVLLDVLLTFKFFLVYYLSEKLINEEFIKKNSKEIRTHVKIITILLFFLTIVNYIFELWPSQIRFGILSNRLFYDHPSLLASICVFLYAMLNLTKDSNYKKKNRIYNLIMFFMIISTLRYKAIGSAFIIIFISYYIYKKQKAIAITKLIPIAIFAILVGWNQIRYYYIDISESARSQLSVKSVLIAKDYFPFGTGFGTYGSHVSGVNYSPVYTMYNMQNIHGLTKKDPSFISDTFWPMIIGQFGFFGLIIYIYILYLIYKIIHNTYDKDEIDLYVAKVISLLYLIILSSSDSSFVNPAAIPFAIIIGIKKKKDDNYEKN